MKYTEILLLLCLSILLSNCSYDSEEDLIEVQNDDDEVPILITYDQDIRPILQNNCVVCHASPPVNGAPFALINYDQVSQRADLILTAISRQNGQAAAMPPPGRLPQSTIDLIEQWIEDEKPEN